MLVQQLEDGAEVGAAAALRWGNLAARRQVVRAVRFRIGVVEGRADVRVRAQHALHLAHQRPHGVVVHAAGRVHRDQRGQGLVVQRLQVQAAPHEPPVEAPEIHRGARQEAPQVRPPVQSRRGEPLQLAVLAQRVVALAAHGLHAARLRQRLLPLPLRLPGLPRLLPARRRVTGRPVKQVVALVFPVALAFRLDGRVHLLDAQAFQVLVPARLRRCGQPSRRHHAVHDQVRGLVPAFLLTRTAPLHVRQRRVQHLV